MPEGCVSRIESPLYVGFFMFAWLGVHIHCCGNSAYGLRRPPVGASMLAKNCHSTLAIWVYISVAAVTLLTAYADPL
jgi:hypothetical protein